VGAFRCKAVGVTATVALEQPVTFEFAQVIAELVEPVCLVGKVEHGDGPEAVAQAIDQALRAHAFGADYISNILRQQRTPRDVQPPVRLKDPGLNQLATDELSLLGYDAFIGTITRRKTHELSAGQTH